MEQTEKKRDFKVLAEKISPENVLIMSELLSIKETKTLIRFMSRHAVIAHAKLCKDVFCKDTRGYVLSDCYDIVQSVAVFLCEHYGEYLDDFLYISKRGKRITIKIECCLIVTRMLCRKYWIFYSHWTGARLSFRSRPVLWRRFCPFSLVFLPRVR